MTSAIPLLRKIDPHRARLEAVARTCRRHDAGMQWSTLPGPASYLRFRLERADSVMVCRVGLRSWLGKHWPDIEGLAWERCEETSLHRLVSASFPPLHFHETRLVYDRARFLGRSDIGGDSETWPCLDSQEGPVWVEQFEGALSRSLPLTWLSSLVIPVDYRIGVARVAVRRLSALRVHDIVLFDMVYGVAYAATQRLFHFNFSMEHIAVEDILSHLESNAMDLAEPTPAPAGLDVSVLSLSIDVVLCRMQQTVGELNDIQQGVTLQLPEDAHRSVRLLVNQQCVAIGEVVQVGERLGVQIASVMPRP